MADGTDNYSDDASIKQLLEKAKNEFNREKRLLIKNLPSNTTEKDIRAFMGFNGEFPVESVQMIKDLSQAIVTLKDPSLSDDAISKLDNTKLDMLTVSVSVYRSEKILCVAHLPLTLTEYKFRELVMEHGNIDMSFLMRSEDTGESKGYGFVEYNEPIEKVGQIKCAIDWSCIEGQTVHCDAIVDSSQSGITFQDLHSKCLIIDNLPKDYTDSFALRQLFSEVVKPIYCQIVTKEGESLGFGILEYDNAEDTEKAFRAFYQHKICGVPMNISYCIPGKSAIHMFNRIMFKYGDKVHVNRASLLPDPVYPNPAFLKHVFFKAHVAKHPRLLVHFTDNLLHLQEGYVKQLEHRTNAKPGLLGPPPTIPMSPLMDINLQLGLLSVIVLDMREKGTYNGEVPEPLGKVKIPKDDEFQEKPQPVSLLGDPMTAQANIILKNLLMPPDKGEFQRTASDESVPKLLGKPVQELNMVYLCSFGRLMAMLSEKNQSMGILGNAPASNGQPKPLMEGLMQAGKVAQTLLNNMGMGQQNPNTRNQRVQENQQNVLGKQQSLIGNQQQSLLGNQQGILGNQQSFLGNQQSLLGNQQSLLGNPPNMNTNMNKNVNNNMNTNFNRNTNANINVNSGMKGNMNTTQAASNFLNTIQQLAKQKMPQRSSNKQDLSSLFAGNNTGNMNNNSSNQGDGLLGNYQGQGRGQSGFQGQMSSHSQPGKQQQQQPQSLMSLNFNNKGEGLIPTPKLEDDSAFGFHGNQGGSYDDSGYQGGYDDTDYNEVYDDSYGNGDGRNTGFQGNLVGQKFTAKKLMDQDFESGSGSNRFDSAYFSGINMRQKSGTGSAANRMTSQTDKRDGVYNDIAQQAAFYAAGAAAAYKQQYEDWINSSYAGSYGNDGSDYGTENAYDYNSGQGNYGNDSQGNYGNDSQMNFRNGGQGNNYGQDMSMAYRNQQMSRNQQSASYGNQDDGFRQMGSSMKSLLGSYDDSRQLNSPQNSQSSNSASLFGRNTATRGNNYSGSFGRDGSLTPSGPMARGLMGPPSAPLQGSSNWGSGTSLSSLKTPQGQKRPFSHVLPSPEPSPEGDYIGQHSQGLGGHYADTYTKRQKLTGRF